MESILLSMWLTEIRLLNFRLSNTANTSLGSNGSFSETGRYSGESVEPLHVKQSKKKTSALAPSDSYSVLSMSSSGKYLAIVCPDIPQFCIYKVSDWSIIDSGNARLLAWDTCCDRYAILESAIVPRIPVIPKGVSQRKAKEAAAAVAQAKAAVGSAASVQVRILLDDGISNVLTKSIGSRSEPVIGLHGGALLGISFRTSHRISPVTGTATSNVQSMPLSGFETSGVSSFSTFDDGFSSQRSPNETAPQNFQLYSWETFEPLGGLLPQPEWTAWDQAVEYCAFSYQNCIAIFSLRPQYRFLGDVAIPCATGAVWHWRQLFVSTFTTIECVFVDAGVPATEIEARKMKDETKLKERPPMLQVVRLASFQHVPSVPSFLTMAKQARADDRDTAMPKENRGNEIAVGGGEMSVAVTRFPAEQKRPVGPLVMAGVRDEVLWLIDRYMCAHALSLSHPGIRCRCLAASGDAVGAVKWASRLAREHHDDLAEFMVGMGYAAEALDLPGISKRLEFDLAMQINDLKRALECLVTTSKSRDKGQKRGTGLGLSDIFDFTSNKENIVEFAREFSDLIEAADASGQSEIAREALERLAAAKGALKGHKHYSFL